MSLTTILKPRPPLGSATLAVRAGELLTFAVAPSVILGVPSKPPIDLVLSLRPGDHLHIVLDGGGRLWVEPGA